MERILPDSLLAQLDCEEDLMDGRLGRDTAQLAVEPVAVFCCAQA